MAATEKKRVTYSDWVVQQYHENAEREAAEAFGNPAQVHPANFPRWARPQVTMTNVLTGECTVIGSKKTKKRNRQRQRAAKRNKEK